MSSYSSQSRSRSRDRSDGPSSRSRSETRPPLPSNPRTQTRAGPIRTGREAYPSSRSLSGSTTASSSSGGSLLDRMKAPSSRTSMEDDAYEAPRRRDYDSRPERRKDERSRGDDRRRDYDDSRREGGYGRRNDYDESRSEGGYARRKDTGNRSGSRRDYDDRDERYERRGPKSRIKESPDEYERDEYYRDDRSNDAPPEEGHGYDLWGRLTSVASKLTINVSQAWEKSIQSADGEVTPPGGESRLTKALKAYHLEKARSPSDLPPWLFDESERGGGRSRSRARLRSETEDYEDRFHPDQRAEPPRSRGFRDIYDNVAKSSGGGASPSAASEAATSKASDRLRQIRDAKRSAGGQTSSRSRSVGVDEPPRAARAPPAPRRGGLPSRPRGY